MEKDTEQLEPIVYSVRELSQILKISLGTAYALTHTEGFPVKTIGRKRIVTKAGLDAWLDHNKKNKKGRS